MNKKIEQWEKDIKEKLEIIKQQKAITRELQAVVRAEKKYIQTYEKRQSRDNCSKIIDIQE